MMYDPMLRKETFEDKPWYGDFLIFHNIGVCQPKDRYVVEVREALARFLFATRTTPGKEPCTTFVMGNGEIGINDMEGYIKAIRGEEKNNQLYVYKIIAEGDYMPNSKAEQVLADMGLTITSIETGYNLDKTVNPLPDVIPGLASACQSTLEDGEYPDGWDYFHYLDKVIAVCDTDDVRDLANKICGVIIDHEDNFAAETLTAELILFCGGGLI